MTGRSGRQCRYSGWEKVLWKPLQRLRSESVTDRAWVYESYPMTQGSCAVSLPAAPFGIAVPRRVPVLPPSMLMKRRCLRQIRRGEIMQDSPSEFPLWLIDFSGRDPIVYAGKRVSAYDLDTAERCDEGCGNEPVSLRKIGRLWRQWTGMRLMPCFTVYPTGRKFRRMLLWGS